jgi:hypothetical protein
VAGVVVCVSAGVAVSVVAGVGVADGVGVMGTAGVMGRTGGAGTKVSIGMGKVIVVSTKVDVRGVWDGTGIGTGGIDSSPIVHPRNISVYGEDHGNTDT